MIHYLLVWIYYVLIICFIGALLGTISHLVFGPFFVDSPDYGYLAAFGFKNGLQYGGVWAGGFSIVLTVIRARKEYLQRQENSEEVSV